MLKKILKYSLFTIITLVLIGAIAIFALDKPRPEGTTGAAAEALADEMLTALNADAYNSTRYIRWTFRTGKQYLWDKQTGTVRCAWDDVVVYLSTREGTGRAYRAGEALAGEEQSTLVADAYTYYNNDSFWLVAPYKIKDPGTERAIVTLEDGREALMVTYTSGGSTPGDSYVWELGDNSRPVAWEMWVSIVPVGGLRLTWEDWTQTDTGFWIALMHEGSILDVPIYDFKDAMQLSDLGEDANALQAP